MKFDEPIQQMDWEGHPSYREFTLKGVKVCEVWLDWSHPDEKIIKTMKLIWVRESFQTHLIGRRTNPMFHIDYRWSESLFWDQLLEMGRKAIEPKFCSYWNLK